MGNNNRRHAWKNDLFIKFMVTICVGFLLQGYKQISENMKENTRFIGEMREFKVNVEKSFTRIDNTIGKVVNHSAITRNEQERRRIVIDFADKLRTNDQHAVSSLCKSFIQNSNCIKAF